MAIRGGRPTWRAERRLVRLTMPFLAELFTLTQHAVSLAVLREQAVLYLETLYPPAYTSHILRTSANAPAYCTAAGKILLACDPGARYNASRPGELQPLTESTITDGRELERELNDARARGIALCRGEYLHGYDAVAAPIFGREDKAIASITVSAPAALLDLDALVPLLRQSAHSASLSVRSRGRLTPGLSHFSRRGPGSAHNAE
ncbi:IclR family transcriptional regulator C-terminal domain-containing protein [Nonomuraea sp. NPDC050404]|uniref:IclR family transcriptional regulator n=1 Tax=Nonomuraea sp. NPDC050404 TaxID=3155783 RepID=UPI00340F46BA